MIVVAKRPIAIAAAVILLLKKSAAGSTSADINGLILSIVFSKATPNCAIELAFGSMIALILPNFLSAWSSTSFTTACDF